MSELLPCKCCDVDCAYLELSDNGFYYVNCPNCGARGSRSADKAEAIATWNRRVPAIPPDVREAIRKLADYGMPLGATNHDWRGWRDTVLTWLDQQGGRP